jgi:hypothetical protein
VFDIPSGCCFPARGFFVVIGRASPSLLLGRMNFLGGIMAVRCGLRGGDNVSVGWIGEEMAGEWLGGGWIGRKRREN